MIGVPGGPVEEQVLLQLERARSSLTVSLVRWRSGAFGVSFGLTPHDFRNPRTKYVAIVADELPAIVHALEEAQSRIADEREAEP